MSTSSFPSLEFQSELRPSQRDVVAIAQKQLKRGERRLHIVAPPGSGKTVLGLYLWAMQVKRPAVVFSPNSAIQSQWAARLDLFHAGEPDAGLVSTDPRAPGLLTSLTYQSVSMPGRKDADQDQLALERWKEKLIEAGEARDIAEATVWIDDLARHNPAYHDDRLATHRKAVREEISLGGETLSTLHDAALAALRGLDARGVGMLILDECHHLMSHWGRVLAEAESMFDDPIVLGLTATPPDRGGRKTEDLKRYDKFFGTIDFEVPTPAVVKDGFLAPYQDLVQLVRPTAKELQFIADTDRRFEELVQELCRPPETAPDAEGAIDESGGGGMSRESMPQWVERVLHEKRLPTGPVENWKAFAKRDPEFAECAPRFLFDCGIGLPPEVPGPLHVARREMKSARLERLAPVVDRYVRHCLRRSKDPVQRDLAERVIGRMRLLGMQITETGLQACASPVSRVLGYSRSKVAAIVPILRAERVTLGESIRAVVIADYEKTSAVSVEVEHLLDAEAGGAVAAFRVLLDDEITNQLDPVLMTGSSVLVDDDLAPRLVEEAKAYIAERNLDVELALSPEDGFQVLNGRGRDWNPRTYVGLITELFQRGVTRCLVGTRGLLGEGWDANKVNVLVDLTTVTTSMTVNQLRGRSIRIDPDDPRKLANNWDVVCIAPEFARGLDDYRRFIAKHRTLYGITDDGAIEKGAGHVHPAFTELEPEHVEESMPLINEEMIQRAARRDDARGRWAIGEPFEGKSIQAAEVRPSVAMNHYPVFRFAGSPWSDSSLVIAVGKAVLGALKETGLIEAKARVAVGARSAGYVRAFLQEAGEDEIALFAESVAEALGPLDEPRYVVPRVVSARTHNWLSKLFPDAIGKYLMRRRRTMAMLHAVPSVLAKKKEQALTFQKHWNAHVSPGKARYAKRGEGEEILATARRAGQVPTDEAHLREIFT